jgi:putative DNA primase/helicase
VTLQEVAARFPGGRWRGDHYETKCQSHDDRHASLGISPGDNGGVVIYCQAGCCPQDVLAAVGLTLRDLAPNGGSPNGARPPPEAIYRYDDEQGQPLYEKVRLPAGAAQRFWLRLPGAKAGGIGETRRVLYHLPALLATAPGSLVGICEGEKDADNLIRHGLPATTNPEGAALPGQRPKWKPEYTAWRKEHVADRRFAVFADQDEAGLAHAEAVYESLKAAGLSVFAVEMPGLAAKEDVSDWLGRHTDAEFQALLKPKPHPLDALVFNGPALLAAELREPEWLVPGLVARAVMTMLVGIGKIGKSVLAHQLTVAGAAGGVWLDQAVPLVRSLYVNWEDPLGLTRARAVQQFAPAVLPAAYHAMQPPWGWDFREFLGWLEQFIQKEDIGLVVIDPLAIAAGWKDENDNSEVGPTLRAIQEVAQRTGAAIPVVHHTRKSPGEGGLEVRGGSAIFAGIQGFMSFRRKGDGFYELDTLNKMPGEYGGERTLLLQRQIHTLTWHVVAEENVSAQEVEKQFNIEEMLSVIRLDPGVTRAELATLIRVSPATLRRYIEPLIAEGVLLEGKRLHREGDASGRPPRGLFFRAPASE